MRARRTRATGCAYLSLVLLLGAWPAIAAPASPSRTSRRAVIEVIDLQRVDRKGKGTARRATRFTMALADNGQPSRVETHDGSTSYQLTVSQRPQKGSTAVVRLDLKCWAGGARRGKRSHGPSRTTEVSLSSRVRLGQRVMLGRIERAGGGELQVAMLLEDS